MPGESPAVFGDALRRLAAAALLFAAVAAAAFFWQGGPVGRRSYHRLRLGMSGGEVVTTDGPFVESKEHLGGFYVVEAEDLDAALAWASKATAAVGKPIEVWPFAAAEA